MPPKLAIIAGKGDLPALILDAALAADRPVFVLALEGQTDPGLAERTEHAWVRLGAAGAAIDAMRRAGAEEVVFAGAVRRPSLLSLGLDARGVKMLAASGRAALGDDGLLSALVAELEGEGFRVVGAHDLLGGLIVGRAGALGRHRPDDIAEDDIARGLDVALGLGRLDVGQAVVVQQGIVLGVEAAEGTDELLARCKGLARKGPGGVLVKIKKPQQERRVDLPTVGVGTIERAADAGLRGIAFEAGATLVIGREAVIAAADSAGLFVLAIGVDP